MTSPTAGSSTNSFLMLPALLLAIFVVPISIAGTATALPAIARDLGSDPTALQWIVNSFNVAFAVFTLVWGTVSDRIGYKPTFLIGVTGTIAASVLSAFAPNLLVLDVARLLAGAAGAAIGVSVTAIISSAYEGAERTRNFALFGTMLGAGLALGPTIAGLLTAAVGWRGVFVAFGAALLLPLLIHGEVPSLRHERRADAPIFDVHLLRNVRFMSIVLLPVIQAFGYVALLTYLPVTLSSVYSLDPGATGLLMLAMTAPVLVGPTLGARMVAKIPSFTIYTLFYLCIALMLIGNAGMLLVATTAPVWVLVIPMLMLGFSFGLPLGFVDGAALDAVPPHSSGAAAGVVSFMRLGSEATVVAVYAMTMAALVSSRVSDDHLAQEVASGLQGHGADYIPAFVTGQIAILAAVVIGLVATIAMHRAVNRAHPVTTSLRSQR
ncbi:MFS transporter [Nocardioides houyundeii]|uniref:MFS transporter n=1 Tax=Nocardioides houyundeii TaxID=2045452 RepID=UPI0013B3A35A|nr:MFS transporter [Nocardioides houyundeii]